MKTVFTCGGANPFKGAKTKELITVQQSESGSLLLKVTYGLQEKSKLTYAQCCAELGQAILHMQCCEGLASNEGV
jgi:hypothetical protein